jgi:hypothetical protein
VSRGSTVLLLKKQIIHVRVVMGYHVTIFLSFVVEEQYVPEERRILDNL